MQAPAVPAGLDPVAVLPSELLFRILAYLPLQSRSQWTCVSRAWRRVACAWPRLWKDLPLVANTARGAKALNGLVVETLVRRAKGKLCTLHVRAPALTDATTRKLAAFGHIKQPRLGRDFPDLVDFAFVDNRRIPSATLVTLCAVFGANLRRLTLSGTSIEDEDLAKLFSRIPALETLSVAECTSITGRAFVGLKDPLALRAANVPVTALQLLSSDATPCSRLRVLDLSQCQHLGAAVATRNPEIAGLFAKLPSLRVLCLNQFGDLLDSDGAKLLLRGLSVDLRHLELRGCVVADDVLLALVINLPRLRVLDVSGCTRITPGRLDQARRVRTGVQVRFQTTRKEEGGTRKRILTA
ncbi:hypothetical protein GGF32_008595 [Allomyces javanicus]|nr:hypothetical protein GGF32_008595 [Allomyces javanicus]